MVSNIAVEIDADKTKAWLKEHKDSNVADTPLWVLINLGVMVLEEKDGEE